MLNISKSFKRELYYDRRNYLAYAEITLENRTRLSLTNTEIWAGGFSTDDAVSEDDNFTALGSTIIGGATLIINNITEAYTPYDFTNAKVILYVGMYLTDGGAHTEKIKKGTYTVDDTSYNGATITLTLLDNMCQFDRPYDTALSYPATLDRIIRDACDKCGVRLNTYSFPHNDYVVQKRPEEEAVTYREVIGWAAAVAGCFARCNVSGELELKWFDQTTLENRSEGYDGGTFTSYSSGVSLDGNNDPDVDAGNFTEDKNIHHINALYSQNTSMDDVLITGVQVTVKIDDDPDAEEPTGKDSPATKTNLVGKSGYIIDVIDNPFITEDTLTEVSSWLGDQLIGLTFRKSNITHASDPSIEAGDIGILWDRKGNEHPILITRSNFSIDNSQTTVCGAETPARNSATRFSQGTKSYVESRRKLLEERTSYEAKLAELHEKIDTASGLYYTEVKQSDGTSKYYYHDKKNLEESNIRILISDVGITVTPNGGKTWYGLEVNGDLIARILTARGVNADWINTGTITSKDGSVAINLDKNTINIKGVTSFDGFATKTGLGTSGYTTINGSNITTGTIKDAGGNTVFNLSSGSLTMKKGSIDIGNFKVDTDGNLTAKNAKLTGADVSGKITSTTGNRKIIINEADLKGYVGSTLYGHLDLCAIYSDGAKHASLEGATYLHLEAGKKISFEVGGIEGSGTEKAYVDSSGFHAGGASRSSVSIPISINSDGTVQSWATYKIVDGIIK
ncbi:MAG: hypothetical protein IJI25_08645 [Eubacterium sp.]|nr:hypothetical protein [Eubacterium sp.]